MAGKGGADIPGTLPQYLCLRCLQVPARRLPSCLLSCLRVPFECVGPELVRETMFIYELVSLTTLGWAGVASSFVRYTGGAAARRAPGCSILTLKLSRACARSRPGGRLRKSLQCPVAAHY